jgi:hypothetical protein
LIEGRRREGNTGIQKLPDASSAYLEYDSEGDINVYWNSTESLARSFQKCLDSSLVNIPVQSVPRMAKGWTAEGPDFKSR